MADGSATTQRHLLWAVLVTVTLVGFWCWASPTQPIARDAGERPSNLDLNPAWLRDAGSPFATPTRRAPDQSPADQAVPPAPAADNTRYPLVDQRPLRAGLTRRLTLAMLNEQETTVAVGSAPPLHRQAHAWEFVLQGTERVVAIDRKAQATRLAVVIDQAILTEGDRERVLLSPGDELIITHGAKTVITLKGGTLDEQVTSLLQGAFTAPSETDTPPLSDVPRALGERWDITSPAFLAAFNQDPRVEISAEHFTCSGEITGLLGDGRARRLEVLLSFQGTEVAFSDLPANFVPSSSVVKGRILRELPIDRTLPEARRQTQFDLKLRGVLPLEGGLEANVLVRFKTESIRAYSEI